MRLPSLVLTAAVALLACQDKTPPAPPPAPPKPAGPPPRSGKVTILVTGHETGVLPTKAARLMAQWKTQEGWPDALAFSTGDSFSGAVLSTHFMGAPTAEVMKAMQYKASALGNHDLDLGLETLQKFRDASGVTLLAANLKDKPESDQPLKLVPSTVVTREGVKVGVVGFTSLKTIATSMSGRAFGLELVPLDASVGPALDSLKKDSPDVVVALIDDCFSVLKPVLAAHADWKVDLVVGTRCEGEQQDLSGATKYFSVGDDLSAYVAATYQLADGKGTLTAARKELAEKGEEDADLVALRTRWKTQLDAELGLKIGFTKTGFKEDAPQLRTLVATALKEQTKADAALINKKGIRAGLPRGDITQAAVHDLIPFENAVVTVKVKGEVLQKLKALPEAFLVAPAKIEAEQEYLLATTEYLYFGGDGLGFEAAGPNPELTGQVWQTPVIQWIQKQATDPKKPLEKLLK
ncbi:MAG: bifunctional metallophosphatase/5'-nucleotidase [Myxococcota bacterium]